MNRDLSGRRQRDVNNEERLKKYVAGAAEREREAREKREEKLAVSKCKKEIISGNTPFLRSFYNS